MVREGKQYNIRKLPIILMHVFGVILMNISCINEMSTYCPEYGKYRVTFYDKDTAQYGRDYKAIAYINSEGALENESYIDMIRPAASNKLISTKESKLLPGKYIFSTILSEDIIFKNSDTIELVNGRSYFYSLVSREIIKLNNNVVRFKYSLINSLILLHLSISKSDEYRYLIQRAEITPPNDSICHINIKNGSVRGANKQSDFFDDCQFFSDLGNYGYFCVPITKNNMVYVKVTLYDKVEKRTILLKSSLFLDKDIKPGDVCRLYFEITPKELKYLRSGISDWEDIICGGIALIQ